MVLAALVGFPQGVNAQPAEEDSLSSWQVDEGASLEQPAPEEPAPTSEPAPEEPALQLKLDEAGIQVMESPPPTVDGYPQRVQITDEWTDPRVRRPRIGFIVSTGVFGFGLLAVGGAGLAAYGASDPDPSERAAIAFGAIAGAGVVGMVTAGGIWGHRWRQLRKGLGNVSDSRTPRRVQWDLARSRLVF